MSCWEASVFVALLPAILDTEALADQIEFQLLHIFAFLNTHLNASLPSAIVIYRILLNRGLDYVFSTNCLLKLGDCDIAIQAWYLEIDSCCLFSLLSVAFQKVVSHNTGRQFFHFSSLGLLSRNLHCPSLRSLLLRSHLGCMRPVAVGVKRGWKIVEFLSLWITTIILDGLPFTKVGAFIQIMGTFFVGRPVASRTRLSKKIWVEVIGPTLVVFMVVSFRNLAFLLHRFVSFIICSIFQNWWSQVVLAHGKSINFCGTLVDNLFLSVSQPVSWHAFLIETVLVSPKDVRLQVLVLLYGAVLGPTLLLIALFCSLTMLLLRVFPVRTWHHQLWISLLATAESCRFPIKLFTLTLFCCFSRKDGLPFFIWRLTEPRNQVLVFYLKIRLIASKQSLNPCIFLINLGLALLLWHTLERRVKEIRLPFSFRPCSTFRPLRLYRREDIARKSVVLPNSCRLLRWNLIWLDGEVLWSFVSKYVRVLKACAGDWLY